PLPTAAMLGEELMPDRSEVASFDPSKLKHVGAEEKNPLPTAAMLGEELMPDRSEVASFDPSKLKHVGAEE
ncbi:thymosin beta, partial [Streptomyces sp. NPDC059173]|uniref:thymosin beta n=1 Tax=Streptomyces sp. NPDC059173 TaxID=3346756 RepID=UPI0036C61641